MAEMAAPAPPSRLAALDKSPRKALHACSRRTVSRSLPLPSSTVPTAWLPVADASACSAAAASSAPSAAPAAEERTISLGDVGKLDKAKTFRVHDAVKLLDAATSAAPTALGGGAGALPSVNPGASKAGLWRAALEKSTGEKLVRRGSTSMWGDVLRGWEDRSAENALRSMPEMHDATEAEFAAMRSYTKLLTLARYAHLWRKGAPMNSFYVLLRGRLRAPPGKGDDVPGTARWRAPHVPTGAHLAGGAWLDQTMHAECPIAEQACVLLWIRASEAKADPALSGLCARLKERVVIRRLRRLRRLRLHWRLARAFRPAAFAPRAPCSSAPLPLDRPSQCALPSVGELARLSHLVPSARRRLAGAGH